MARLVSSAELLEDVLLGGILEARERVRIATANVKNFTVAQGRRRVSIASLLRDLCGRGVRVELLHGAVPTEPFLHELKTGAPFRSESFEMRFCPRVHMKIAVIDYSSVYVGSANLTGAGIGDRNRNSRNFELGVLFEDEATIDEVCALFDRVWSGEECRECLRKKECPVPLERISF